MFLQLPFLIILIEPCWYYLNNFLEPGDLIFDAGEQIEVTKKENEWWTGKIGERSGVFPYNYVEPVASETNGVEPVADPVDANPVAVESIADPVIEDPVEAVSLTVHLQKNIVLFFLRIAYLAWHRLSLIPNCLLISLSLWNGNFVKFCHLSLSYLIGYWIVYFSYYWNV